MNSLVADLLAFDIFVVVIVTYFVVVVVVVVLLAVIGCNIVEVLAFW